MVISNLQQLDRINAMEKSEPIWLSLQNQILTSENENSTDSEDSDSDPTDSESPPALKGDKVTKSFLSHGISSKAQLADLVKSVNNLGAHIIDLDTTVDHVADNVKDQSVLSLHLSHLFRTLKLLFPKGSLLWRSIKRAFWKISM